MRVLGFGTYDAARHPRAGILLAGLAELGVTVTEVNAPLGLSTAERVRILHQPWRLPALAARLGARWVALAAGHARGRAARPDAVLVGYLGQFDVLLARALFPRTRIVLDLLVLGADTAADRGARGGVVQRLTRALDAAALRASDLVVVDTQEQAALVPPRHRHRVVVAPVGADPLWYAARRPVEEPAGPLRVVFFGWYTPLQGAPVIGAALARLADLLAEGRLVVTMIGTGQDLAATREAAGRHTGIGWVDEVTPADLPVVVAGHDVCLGIFGTTPKAARVVPNKVFQGAAAGCVVVTGDTAPQRRALAGAGVLVPPGDPEALAGALRTLAGDPTGVARLRRVAADRADAAFRPRDAAAPLLRALEDDR